VFFLKEPPLKAGVPTSFRKAPALGQHDLGPTEVRQIRWARRLQQAASWAVRDRGDDPVLLPATTVSSAPAEVAATAREATGIVAGEQLDWGSASEAFRVWRSVMEETGISVLQLQLGKNNIRGCSAWDDYAPLVAVNTAYHPTARIFTLLHEYAHLLTRTDSACFQFIVPTSGSDDAVERWCERFAAAFLLPADSVRVVLQQVGGGTSVTDPEIARKVANRFKVSTRATALRLQELGLAAPGFYAAIESYFAQYDWNTPGGGGGGQPAPEKRLGQLGTLLPDALLAAESAGRLTRRDVAGYLKLTVGQVDDLRSLVAR
jgi:Zn-dependent peptidase ImmA (M78 family)